MQGARLLPKRSTATIDHLLPSHSHFCENEVRAPASQQSLIHRATYLIPYASDVDAPSLDTGHLPYQVGRHVSTYPGEVGKFGVRALISST
jgi:hypothetical protein